MRIKQVLTLVLAFLMLTASAVALEWDTLPMDTTDCGPAPKDENYISENEYVDDTLSVKIHQGRYADTDYIYAHIKIVHPSQLRTAPATIVNTPQMSFRNSAEDHTIQGRYIARAVNAVFAINGDFFVKPDNVKVVLRQSTQVRNVAYNPVELLAVDKNGDFHAIRGINREQYAAYYEENKDNLYQVFCFGPILVENGVSVIPSYYENGSIGAHKPTQRSAICQLGPLEYMVVVCYGPQSKNNKGMTVYEFSQVCELAGKELSENGCQVAYNLDGGNSATMLFKRPKDGKMAYVKVNCPEIERDVSDIIYFATLEK